MGECPIIYSITAVESLNQVVILGGRNKSDPHILQINPDTGQVEQETEWDLCQHVSNMSLDIMVLNRKECVAVSCRECKDVKLCNTGIKRVERSIRLSDEPHHMCSGPDGSLFVRFDGGKIQQVNVDLFNIIINRFDTGLKYCNSMRYLPEPHDSLVQYDFSDTVQAVSARDGSVKWEREYNNYRPCDLLYHPQHDLLLVSVWDQPELLVINPVDGSLLKTFHLQQNNYWVYRMCLSNDQIIMVQWPKKYSKRRILSHYRLNKLTVHDIK